MTPPLVSFTLMVYNHAPFVKKAILSALAQDYPNLEIIISDDASTDGSQAIIEETVKGYDGPHRVKVNLEKNNLFFKHIPKIMSLCEGEFIVQGHGDDLFHPSRATEMVKAWKASGASVVTCNALMIDAEEKPLRYWQDPNGTYDTSLEGFVRNGVSVAGFGAGMGWSKALFDTWGPLPPGPRQMDLIFAWRGCLMSGAHFIKEPLIFYRQHGENMSMWALRERAKSDSEKLWVEERRLSNVTANVLAMLDDATAHLSRHPGDERVKNILVPLSMRLLQDTRGWTHFRHEMASQRIGVV